VTESFQNNGKNNSCLRHRLLFKTRY